MSSVNLLEGLSRTVVYMTHSQLTALVSVVISQRFKGSCRRRRRWGLGIPVTTPPLP